MVLCICQGNLNKIKMGILNKAMLSTRHIIWFALNLVRLSAFLLHRLLLYESKKIIRISDKIKKSFLFILSASFLLKGGKHSTVRVFLNIIKPR